MTIEPDRLYKPAEVAEILQCGATNVYNLMRRREIAVTSIGAGKKGFRVLGSDITAFLASRREGGPEPKMRFKLLGLSS